MNPQVSVATSAFMIFFTGSSTVAQYGFMGSLSWDYCLWYGSFGLVSGLIGQIGVSYIISKLKRTSIIVYTIAITIFLASILLSVTGTINIARDFRAGKPMGFKPICS
jgi:uncharacterized membrane protein YfcA